jgi:hypothetical protein
MDIAAKVTGYGGHEWVVGKPKAAVLVCCAATISHLPSLQEIAQADDALLPAWRHPYRHE